MKLISLAEAAFHKIDRVRLPNWANKLDHLKLDLIGEPPGFGPWLHLYAPFNLECNGRDPVDLPWALGDIKTDVFQQAYEVYDGPLPDSEQYKAAQAQFEGSLGRAEKRKAK